MQFKVPEYAIDEEDVWPLSLLECETFIGLPAQCNCGTYTIIPKWASYCQCTGCPNRVWRFMRIKSIGPLDPAYDLADKLAQLRSC